MSSPGQRRGKCGHVMANFDTHSHYARSRDKGKEPCVSDPQTSNCQICNNLASDQRQQLATPSYKLKKEKREAKLTEPTPSQDSEQLVDPSSVSVIGVVDEQGSVKSPDSVPPPDKKPKKDNKNSKKEKSPSTKVSKHSTDEKFAELDSKWSERFSRLEAFIMAKSFEPTFSSKVKVAPTHSPPHDVENVSEPFIRPSTSKLTGTGFSAEKHQPTSQAVTSQQASTTKFPGTGFSASKHQPATQARSHRPTSTARFTGQGSSAIVHQPTSQTKVNRPTTTTTSDPSAKFQSTGEGDGNRPCSDRPATTDRPLSSEPADTGSPALHRSRRGSTSSLSSEAGSMLSDNPPLDLYTEEGELSEDQDQPITDPDQPVSEEQNYRDTMQGIRSFMGWSHIPEMDSTASTSDDNPFAGPKTVTPAKCRLKCLLKTGYVGNWPN